ncbi:La ribonucleoprotein [Desmophyllum pertusum]|uniref:La ribonucleoprotein n=1 Tax=Desmophyllum pertusum TaxID=174260 RepID=A0A9X0CVQ5_9CNID|nr:La ribonucleoprotein [Desmophyllum pertusum]
MAAVDNKRRVSKIDYQQLHNLSSVVLYDTPKKKLKTYPQTYNVERIIYRRKVRNDHEYLIKWEGWPLESCTWEPSSHLTPELLRNYDNPPRPSQVRLHEAGRQVYSAILSSLKSKSLAPAYIPMELDLWRYVSKNKGVDSDHKGFKLYKREELSLLNSLPNHWWYFLNDHGQGQAAKSPLKIKAVLSWTPAHQIYKDGKLIAAPRMPLEKLCVDILRRPCDADNLFEVE